MAWHRRNCKFTAEGINFQDDFSRRGGGHIKRLIIVFIIE